MELVRLGLLLLALMWACQLVAAWLQMRYYRTVVRRTAGQWTSGFLGASSFKPRLGPGAIAIVVIDNESRVCEALSMSGLSVFARFKKLGDLAGSPLSEFKQRLSTSTLAPGVKQALGSAFDVACRTASERQQAATKVAMAD
jgi:glucitol operon activator protein